MRKVTTRMATLSALWFLVISCKKMDFKNDFEKIQASEITAVYFYKFERGNSYSSIGSHNYTQFPVDSNKRIIDSKQLMEFSKNIRNSVRSDWNHWSTYDDDKKYMLRVITNSGEYTFYATYVTYDNGSFWVSFQNGDGYLVPNI